MEEKKIEEMSFEEALSEFEAIVSDIEKGDITLDEITKMYVRGNELRKYCQSKLETAKAQIEEITNSGNSD